jgi:hypothetical protein
MAPTPRELFRAGNAGGARFDILRPGEVLTVKMNGIDWVYGRSGGASTLESPLQLGGKWWRLPAGAMYDDTVLYLYSDFGDHWSWEPTADMPLTIYVSALTDLNGRFVRV